MAQMIERPYLSTMLPHCLLRDRSLRCERFRFRDMGELLAFRAYLLFQAVERLTLTGTERDRRAVAMEAELMWMLGGSEALIACSMAAGRAIGEATLRGEQVEIAAFYPWYAMP